MPLLAQPVKTTLELAQVPSNSPLSSGQWYRIAVVEEGIYKLDYDFLSDLGINPIAVDPSRIKIFGNGGQQLPQPNAAPRYWGLQQNAILVTGAEDGSFNIQDQILFYGQSSDIISYDPEEKEYHYQNNIYSDTSYYFLTVEGEKGVRIAEQGHINGQFEKINFTDQFYIHDLDSRNILSSGKWWVGEALKNRLEVELPISSLALEGKIRLDLSLVSTTLTPNSLMVNLGSSKVGTITIDALADCEYCDKGILKQEGFSVSADQVDLSASPKIILALERTTAGNPVAYLDHIFLNYPRLLDFDGEPFMIQASQSLDQPFSTYKISYQNVKPMVWDVSEPLAPLNQETISGAGEAQFSVPSMELKKFMVFNPSQAKVPIAAGAVENQDLLGTDVPDLLIVTHPEFVVEANRLANFRITHDQLEVAVVTTKQVYNDFSSGSEDLTAIRDFARFLYRQPGGEKLKYLLLFGKGSYDFKDITPGNQNLVPVYQSENSFDPIFSYCSDDYFGFLDLEEGDWVESASDHDLDLAVGRLPVINREEAGIVVDKLINYSSSDEAKGNWRQRLLFLADDGNDKRDFLYYLRDSENLYNFLKLQHPQFEVKKFYVDAYPQLVSPGREEVPELIDDFEKELKQGALIVNYSGHGSRRELASERVIDLASVNEYTNNPKLPLFITATCEFGEHDNPAFRSGAEYLLVNPKGGAIGLISTARPVYASTNFLLNRSFYESFYQVENGRHRTIGEIFVQTKNKSVSGALNRSFTLLGDPSLTLNYPKNQVKITHINRKAIDDQPDTLKALQKISVQGKVQNYNGHLIPGFNGQLEVAVFDKERTLKTLGTGGPATNYLVRDNTLFRGKATVNQGLFNFDFIMPKNIVYQLGSGKMILYAVSEQGVDGGGAETQFLIGSSSVDFPGDDQPPEIKLYLNDTTFRNGGITSENPLLLAHLTDESGIDISKGNLNSSLRAILDGEETFALNEFYLAETDSYQTGLVKFPLNGLSPGYHKLVLKARDIYNNPSEAQIEFYVKKSNQIVLKNLNNFPNPFRGSTVFTFQHNQAGQDLSVDLEIFGMAGRRINGFSYVISTSPTVISLPEWFGTDTFGKKLQSGIYLYRLTVRSIGSDIMGSTTNKLIILN